MVYQVLARKYRPRNFGEVIGQEEVTRTLERAILNGRLASAYIFCGPRGIGKTSVARLVANKLNCTAPLEKSPCGKCEMCKDALKGSSMDILEIDGASNNSVDQVRTLRENVKFTPAKGKYKIYIIDEVHMLSTGAFNALLKTLEEPPEHVKFIFATTEAHKVPATIISRCQRFDFRKISTVKIQENLMRVAKKEKMDLDGDAAFLIARSSDGSLRDSLVILEQMHSFSGGRIIPEDVVELLGMLRNTHLDEIIGAVLEGDAGSAVKMLDGLISGGGDVRQITGGLIKYMRDMMVVKACGHLTGEMAFTDEEEKLLLSKVEKASLEEIIYMLQHLAVCSNMIRSIDFSRAALELTLIKLAKRGDMMSLPEVLRRLEGLKEGPLPQRRPVKDAAAELEVSSEPAKPGLEPGPAKASENSASPEHGGGEEKLPGQKASAQDYEKIESQWATVLKLVRNEQMSSAMYLEPARPLEINGNELVIGFPKKVAFHRDVLSEEPGRSIVLKAIKKLAPSISRLKLVVVDLFGEEGQQEDPPAKPSMEKVRPVIEQVMDVFGGHVIRDYMEDSQ